ncbi:MAG: dodecin family protein [Bacillota bacterium]|nr:dodecin family protein [Bacillota bacterium]
MTVIKVIEILAESKESWEDAVQKSVKVAAKTIDNIKSVYIKNIHAIVENNEICGYRVNAKTSFIVEED